MLPVAAFVAMVNRLPVEVKTTTSLFVPLGFDLKSARGLHSDRRHALHQEIADRVGVYVGILFKHPTVCEKITR